MIETHHSWLLNKLLSSLYSILFAFLWAVIFGIQAYQDTCVVIDFDWESGLYKRSSTLPVNLWSKCPSFFLCEFLAVVHLLSFMSNPYLIWSIRTLVQLHREINGKCQNKHFMDISLFWYLQEISFNSLNYFMQFYFLEPKNNKKTLVYLIIWSNMYGSFIEWVDYF